MWNYLGCNLAVHETILQTHWYSMSPTFVLGNTSVPSFSLARFLSQAPYQPLYLCLAFSHNLIMSRHLLSNSDCSSFYFISHHAYLQYLLAFIALITNGDIKVQNRCYKLICALVIVLSPSSLILQLTCFCLPLFCYPGSQKQAQVQDPLVRQPHLLWPLWLSAVWTHPPGDEMWQWVHTLSVRMRVHLCYILYVLLVCILEPILMRADGTGAVLHCVCIVCTTPPCTLLSSFYFSSSFFIMVIICTLPLFSIQYITHIMVCSAFLPLTVPPLCPFRSYFHNFSIHHPSPLSLQLTLSIHLWALVMVSLQMVTGANQNELTQGGRSLLQAASPAFISLRILTSSQPDKAAGWRVWERRRDGWLDGRERERRKCSRKGER